jgi:hypothetical protein
MRRGRMDLGCSLSVAATISGLRDVLVPEDITMTDHPRKAWNGGSREAAMKAAAEHREDARQRLSKQYAEAIHTMHPFEIGDPYQNEAAPGWVYLPVEDAVILHETARRIAERFAP